MKQQQAPGAVCGFACLSPVIRRAKAESATLWMQLPELPAIVRAPYWRAIKLPSTAACCSRVVN